MIPVIKSPETFKELSDSATGKGSLLVVHFWAEWASQCQQMDDVIAELSKNAKYSSITFAKLEAEAVPEVSMKFSVTSVPTILILKNGEMLDRVDGANAPELTKKVDVHSKSFSASGVNQQTQDKEALNLRLKKLVNSAKVMLFMKGSPDNPRCGFSRQIVDLLGKYQAKYSSFDIFSDEVIRQGLKEYSNWPTYPQLYINGELIGGLDIVREMEASGELESMLPKAENLEDRLKSLINQSPLMVFMKGDRENPRCGFSKTLIGILNNTKLPYGTFDILSDEEVRQGLKTFSQWPTYPQIYVKGELIGGLDIIKEIEENGELIQTLKGE